jgi:hypothetical protein
VIALGRWLRVATIRDEEWIEGPPLADPRQFAAAVKASGLAADIFVFSGPFGAPLIEQLGRVEMENAAVIRIDTYKAWWEALSQESRRNARLAGRKGIEIRPAIFDDGLVKGIKEIYDETPVRQGRRFWHYGKDPATVKRENGTYAERSQFLGAYHGGQLVGFAKIVYIGEVGRIMQILCLDAHRDKRPATALMASAVEDCHRRQARHLVYGKYSYGRKIDTLAEFKRRLGFEECYYPRYYVPLSWRGHLAVKLGLHAGWLALLPAGLVSGLLKARTWGLETSMRFGNVLKIPNKKRPTASLPGDTRAHR